MEELLTPEIAEETVSPPEPQDLEAEEAVQEEADPVLYEEILEELTEEDIMAEAAPVLPIEILEEALSMDVQPEAEPAPAVEIQSEPELDQAVEIQSEPEPDPETAVVHKVDPTPVQKLLAANIGHYISCEFFIGDRQAIRREGLLTQVGDEYFTLLEEQSDAQMLCNIHHAKFITIYAKDDVPMDRFRPQGRMSGLYPGSQFTIPGQGSRRPYRR